MLNIKISKQEFLTGDSSFIIDFIRVLACEMVVVCHAIGLYSIYFDLKETNTNIYYSLCSLLGSIGVTLFFIVSGIVISNSLFKKIEENKSYKFRNFFVDRFSRIYSGLVPCLFFVFICDILIFSINADLFYKFTNIDFIIDKSGIVIKNFIGSLLMIQNMKLIGTKTPAFMGVVWTLNIEWWLYLLFGWVVFNYNKLSKHNYYLFAPILIFGYYPIQEFYSTNHQNLPFVWIMGVVITIIYLKTKTVDVKIDYYILIVLTMIFFRITLNSYRNTGYYDIILELLIVVLVSLLTIKYKDQNNFDKTSFKRIIVFMSKYSFTLYLIHYVIEGLIFTAFITYALNCPIWEILFFSVIVANIIAIVIAYPTEMRYKDLTKFLNNLINKHGEGLHSYLNTNHHWRKNFN
jgi:peptidoglycan/LPS O-acetylase OafA/YrhL